MIYVIRHASAGRRTDGPGDADRELDEVGQIQATRIADALGAAGIDTLMSSRAVRCRQTMAPLAARLGIEVETDQSLYEGEGAHEALALVLQLAEAGSAAALCSHGDIVPHLLDLLAAQGVELTGNGCAKGSIWTLSVGDGAITGATYTARP